MADPDKKTQRRLALHAVDSEDFVRFLADKAGDEDPCPVCKDDNWLIMCPDEGPTFRFGLPVRNVEKVFYASVFMYHCINCGFVRLHSSRVVSEWVREHPPEIDQDTDQAPDSEEDTDV